MPQVNVPDFARRVASGDLGPDVAEWLRSSFALHLSGMPIDTALGFDRASRIRARNQALKAAAILTGQPSPWLQAKALAEAIRRFESQVLPLLDGGRLNRRLTPLEGAIRRSMTSGARPLRSLFKIHELLR